MLLQACKEILKVFINSIFVFQIIENQQVAFNLLIKNKLVKKNRGQYRKITLGPKLKNMLTTTVTKTLSFYKESGIWYADLPEFLEAGLGTKANLMMVDGSDTFLDYLSNETNKATLKISTETFEGYDAELNKKHIGMNKTLLDEIGHAFVDYGAYYDVEKYRDNIINHQLWLCPVTEYVFEGGYPDKIYIKKIENK